MTWHEQLSRASALPIVRSATGMCWCCRPEPNVHLEFDGNISIDGFGKLSIDKALRLAHKIIDTVTP